MGWPISGHELQTTVHRSTFSSGLPFIRNNLLLLTSTIVERPFIKYNIAKFVGINNLVTVHFLKWKCHVLYMAWQTQIHNFDCTYDNTGWNMPQEIRHRITNEIAWTTLYILPYPLICKESFGFSTTPIDNATFSNHFQKTSVTTHSTNTAKIGQPLWCQVHVYI